jgi:hypothetical protein
VIGPLFINAILIIGIFAMLVVVYFRITNDDVKARALFVTFLTVGIILGLGMETLAFTTAPDSTREQRYNLPRVIYFAMILLIGFFSVAAILVDVKWDDKKERLRWSRYCYLSLSLTFGFTLGQIIGLFMVLVLVLARPI